MTTHRLLLWACAVAAVSALCASSARAGGMHILHLNAVSPAEAEVPTTRVYFTLAGADEAAVEAFRARLESAGARAVNWFAPDVVVAQLPKSAMRPDILSAPGVAARMESEVPSGGGDLLGAVRRAYDLAERPAGGVGGGLPGEFRDVVLQVTPEQRRAADKAVQSVPSLAAGAAGAPARSLSQNSEILTGRVRVYLLFPESNGAVDGKIETWYEGDGTTVNQDFLNARSNAFAALLFWQGAYRSMGIEYDVFDKIVPTSYEPILHQMGNDDLWVMDVLRQLEPDIEALHITDEISAGHLFNEKRRGSSDWIYTAFIGHSRTIGTHRFGAGEANYTAYAFLGGPYLIIPYPAGGDPNDVGENLVFSQIFNHESGHIFWALDEYPGSPDPCSATSGYLNYANMNVTMVGPSGEAVRCIQPLNCIMHSAAREDVGRPFCYWSRGQMGIIDANGNAIPDVFESAPIIEFEGGDVDTVETDEFTVRLTAYATAVHNQNAMQDPADRMDYAAGLRDGRFGLGGGTVALVPLDGSWGGKVENFAVHLKSLTPGVTRLNFVVHNAASYPSIEATKTIYYIGVAFSRMTLAARQDYMELNWEIGDNTWGAAFDVYRLAATDTVSDLGNYEPGETMPGTLVQQDVQPYKLGAGGYGMYRVNDRSVTPGHDYRYYVNARISVPMADSVKAYQSPSRIVGQTAMIPIPPSSILSAASPNPFRDVTTLSLAVPATKVTLEGSGTTYEHRAATRVEIAVYDVAGRRVRTLRRGEEFTDVVTVRWDGTADNGGPVPSGVYFVKAKAGSEVGVQKVLLIR